MNQEFMDKLAKSLGMSKETQDMLGTAAAHDYWCCCETCKTYWKHMGADPETGNYGPFSAEEIATVQ